jgi:hypothetical protein
MMATLIFPISCLPSSFSDNLFYTGEKALITAVNRIGGRTMLPAESIDFSVADGADPGDGFGIVFQRHVFGRFNIDFFAALKTISFH